MSQMTSYRGTRAKPKPNIPTTANISFLTRRLFEGTASLLMTLSVGPYATRLLGVNQFGVRWCNKGVVWRWRFHSPLQTLRAFPNLGCRFLSTAYALDHYHQQDQLGRTEQEPADTGDAVE